MNVLKFQAVKSSFQRPGVNPEEVSGPVVIGLSTLSPRSVRWIRSVVFLLLPTNWKGVTHLPCRHSEALGGGAMAPRALVALGGLLGNGLQARSSSLSSTTSLLQLIGMPVSEESSLLAPPLSGASGSKCLFVTL